MANMLERAVPRYTSYPTAPNFSTAVDADVFGSWLSSLPGAAALSLYLHVPFCRELCHYCGCHTKATLRDEPIIAYAQRLVEEIAIVASHTGRRKVTHIHWGGGTPSILDARQLQFIADKLAHHFDLSTIREHAIELDPRYLTPELAKALRDIGVNRASLGVQDFSEHVQQAAGRIQPFETVKQAVDTLNDFGIDRINIDLMYGLPKQTVADVRRTASLAHSLQPQRVAVFGYAHVPWFRPQQRLIAESRALAEELVDEKKLALRLRRIRETGYLIAPSHDIAGVTDICAPILDQSDRALAGIVIPCLKRTRRVDRHEEVARALLATCQAISSALQQAN